MPSDVSKFRFVSPGIFINEIDQSQIPALPEAVGPVKISSTAKKKIISIYDSLDQEIKLQIPCYSLFGVYAQNNPFFTKTIKDNQWIEINDLIDLEKAKTKINKLNK